MHVFCSQINKHFRENQCNNIYCCFNRLLIPIQDIVEESGVDVLAQFDADGHTPIHWAALGGHTHAMRYFVQMKVSAYCFYSLS